MDGESQKPPEPSIKQDLHEKSINQANEAFKVASEYFLREGTSDSQRYTHLGSVANLGHVLTIGDAEMTDALQSMGHDIRHEGLTQWATLFLTNRTPQFNPPVTDKTYTDEVAAIIDSFSTLQNDGLSQAKIEELMLDLALTGDFSKIRTAMPLPEHLKKYNFHSDYLVTNLIEDTYTKFQLAGFDRILGKQS